MKEEVTYIQLWLKSNGYDACIIPQADPHQSEYIENHYRLISHLSGFTGSAGTLIVTLEQALLFTDSRYHIQASLQLKGSGIELMKCGLPDVPSPEKWLSTEMNGSKVAANARLFSIKRWAELSEAVNMCDDAGFETLWRNRPALCDSTVYIHDLRYSGESVESKLTRLRAIMKEQKADYAIASNLDDIAWLLNIRGSDVECNPVVRSFVIVSASDCTIFIDNNKISDTVAGYFKECGIVVKGYDEIDEALKMCEGTALYDENALNQHLFLLIKERRKINLPLYIARLRAVKNSVEIDGYHRAMINDGVVWVRFYKWFNDSLESDSRITEIDVMDKLRELKAEQELFVDESFGTIAGYAAHGAIGHYAATDESNAIIEHRGFLVIDTGTHYLCGTTDTTRTLVCGTLTDEEKRDYTLVLKGHIALGTAVFPKGVKGSQLDILARQFLWNESMNYGHGTGHGVGHLLNVHEGYAWLRPSENNIGYEPGLTMTDEPGVYREGKHGVRIENTVLVVPYSKSEFGEFLTFEHLTLAPYAIGAIDLNLLTADEKRFLNNYNNNLKNKLKPYLSASEYEFLETIAYEI